MRLTSNFGGNSHCESFLVGIRRRFALSRVLDSHSQSMAHIVTKNNFEFLIKNRIYNCLTIDNESRHEIVDNFSHYGNASGGGGVQHVTEKFVFCFGNNFFAAVRI